MERIFLSLLSIALGAAGAAIVARHGGRLGLLDTPSARSSHTRTTPKGGGIGILAAILVAGLGLGFPWIALVALFAVSAVSLIGDRMEISPRRRLAIQFACAAAAFLGSAPLSGLTAPAIAALSLPALVFIVGTGNFYNFMDGINGIAGITGVVSFGLLARYAAILGAHPALSGICAAAACACLGFLPFNIPRARVFMGDVGSVLLGFLFSLCSLIAARTLTEFTTCILFLSLFYADELTTMASRLRDGENLLQPHRRHLYQLLANEHGIHHWKVSAGYGAAQLAFGATAIAMSGQGLVALLGLWLAVLGLFALARFIVSPSRGA